MGCENMFIIDTIQYLNVFTGANVIVVNMRGVSGYRLLEQADNSNMFRKGYAWIVTQGITTYTGAAADTARLV